MAQETTVEFDFTVFEMVMIGRTPHKKAFERDDDTDRAVAAQAIERVGCEHLAARSFNTLSGGEKQRVLIARALTQGADHLILDEPTNHLDIRYQIEVLELVAGLDVTVLAALHDLSLAALFCDTVYLLDRRAHRRRRAPPTVITTETVRHAYGADVLIVDHPETGTPHLIPAPVPAAGGPAPVATTASRPRPAPNNRKERRVPALLPSPSARPADHSAGARAWALGAAQLAARRACGSSSHPPRPGQLHPATTAAASAYPVTVSNCGTSITYTQAPTRAVSNDINTTEDMLALGLESHMVG